MKTSEAADGDSSNGNHDSGNSLPVTSLRTISSSNSITSHTNQPQGYVPIAAKGHKESVYALAMNDTGTLLVSGGTEKVYSYVVVTSINIFLSNDTNAFDTLEAFLFFPRTFH